MTQVFSEKNLFNKLNKGLFQKVNFKSKIKNL